MTSTCTTVSTEEVKRFAEQKARELGLTDLLHTELMACVPQTLPIPTQITGFRNGQIRLRNMKKL